MECIKQCSTFNLPLTEIVTTFREIYSHWTPDGGNTSKLHHAECAADVVHESQPT